MKKIIIPIVALAIAGAGLFYFYLKDAGQKIQTPVPQQNNQNQETQEENNEENKEIENNEPATSNESGQPVTNETPQAAEYESENVIGKSAGGYDITAYHFGTGKKEVLLVGGIHGGYAWNTALLAYQMVDFLKANPSAVPANVKVTIIPVLNPDGLSKVVEATGRFKPSDVSTSQQLREAGRFNANNVDLNRNFDCNWKTTAVWQNKTVSGGTKVFSEPEAAAIRDYAKNPDLTGVVAWYSAAGGVFSSSCGSGILPETQTMTDIYAKASGYPAYKDFNYYEVTGDMTNWFAKNNVPAIGVVLSTYDDVEWEKNLAGIKAILEHFGQ